MRRFRVYFQQVNRTYFDVDGIDEKDAQAKATSLWEHEYGPEVVKVMEWKEPFDDKLGCGVK